MSKEKKNLNHINIWCYFAFNQESILICTLAKMQGLLSSSFKLAEREPENSRPERFSGLHDGDGRLAATNSPCGNKSK